ESFDFTNTYELDAMAGQYFIWHRMRANADGGSEWKFVYPGFYTVQSGSDLRIEGPPALIHTSPALGSYTVIPPANLGKPDSVADAAQVYANNFAGIQLNNAELAGPNQVSPYWSTNIAYGAGEMVTYWPNGPNTKPLNRYRCKAALAGSGPFTNPQTDTTHWEPALGPLMAPFGTFARNADI